MQPIGPGGTENVVLFDASAQACSSPGATRHRRALRPPRRPPRLSPHEARARRRHDARTRRRRALVTAIPPESLVARRGRRGRSRGRPVRPEPRVLHLRARRQWPVPGKAVLLPRAAAGRRSCSSTSASTASRSRTTTRSTSARRRCSTRSSTSRAAGHRLGRRRAGPRERARARRARGRRRLPIGVVALATTRATSRPAPTRPGDRLRRPPGGRSGLGCARRSPRSPRTRPRLAALGPEHARRPLPLRPRGGAARFGRRARRSSPGTRRTSSTASRAPVLYDLGDFLDDYRVDLRLRNDLGLLFLVELERRRASPARSGPAEARVLPTPGSRDGDDAAWMRRRFRELCAELGTEVTETAGRLVIGWT